MILLALDSTATVATAAIVKDGTVLAADTLQCGRTHSETLLPLIETLYQKAGLTPYEIDIFACSAGPGSFTGVRIGVALIKGLAFGGRPCVGVSTLEALAENLSAFSGIISPVMDARRGQVYNALFRAENGVLTRLTPDRVIMLEDLNAELAAYHEPIRLCGDGYALTETTVLHPQKVATSPELVMQNAVSVAKVAMREYRMGKAVSDRVLRPIYLRAPQAERERNEKLKQTT
ncbi:MAG: tRNA (adenosine(37)-N6)-threonylcarbamoyltransferase complex dimerization subunit type 1 TsaB [Clostridia bacterium]|nr:tRNA (adenosine(37)-N6)-threonylcarbamoyltransferase complex dimerization subunit type 1 TsaB [Clostridia bacterium]